jgi:hypothetical protein
VLSACVVLVDLLGLVSLYSSVGDCLEEQTRSSETLIAAGEVAFMSSFAVGWDMLGLLTCR